MAERAPRGEVAVMVAVQSALVDRPGCWPLRADSPTSASTASVG